MFPGHTTAYRADTLIENLQPPAPALIESVLLSDNC